MTRKFLYLVVAAVGLGLAGSVVRAEPGEVRELRLAPSTTGVPLGHARLSVEPLRRGGGGEGSGGLSAGYRVDVSPLRIGSEAGKLTVAVSDADLRRLGDGQSWEFSGQATSTDGNVSQVHGTATPSSGEAGAIKVRVEGKRGKLVFRTTYQLGRKG